MNKTFRDSTYALGMPPPWASTAITLTLVFITVCVVIAGMLLS